MNSIIIVPSTDAGNEGMSIRKRRLTQSYPTHLHNVFELEFIVDGEAIAHINGQPLKMNKNSIKFCTPLDIESIELVTSSLSIININFTENFIDSEILNEMNSGFLVRNINPDILNTLLDEFNRGRIYSRLYQKNLLNLILLDMLRQRAFTGNGTAGSDPPR